MKRIAIILLIVSVLVLAGSSCFLKTLAKEELAKLTFIAFIETEGEPEDPFVGVMLGEVAEGDVISSKKADGSDEFQPMAIGQTIGGPGHLFYLDMAPGAFYDHPGRLVVVGHSQDIIFDSGVIEGIPVVNNEIPEILKIRTEYVKAVIWDKWKMAKIHIADWIMDIVARIVRKGAVITSGLTPTQSLYAEARDARDLVSTAFKSLLGDSNVRDVKYVAGGAAPNWAAVQNAMNDLIINQKMNFLTLYFVAHGNTNLMNLGGTTFYASQLRSYIMERPDVMFCVIIESCRAGSWIDGLKSGGVMPENIRIVIATTTATKSAYPDWDYIDGVLKDHNPTDQYVEWTGDFLQQLAYYTSDANWPTVTSYATTHSIDTALALYYLSYMRIKGGSPATSSLTLTERSVAGAIQQPMIYKTW